MKYMILTQASQLDYDAMGGKGSPQQPAWAPEDFAALSAFMEAFNTRLEESGELVETRALAPPVHTRRIQLQGGVPVTTDGPYAETQEVQVSNQPCTLIWTRHRSAASRNDHSVPLHPVRRRHPPPAHTRQGGNSTT